MPTLYCADCEEEDPRFEPDDDHVWVTAEFRRVDETDDEAEYAFHERCWRELTENWRDPV